MKTQKIYRKSLQRYLFDEITLTGICSHRGENTLLTKVYIPPQLDFDEMYVHHLWVDGNLFTREMSGKRVWVTGEVYYYDKGVNNYSYSVTPKKVWKEE